MSKRKHENIKRRLSQVRIGSNSNSNSNKTVNYPLTTKQQNNILSRLEKALDRVKERINMLKSLHRSIRVNHTGFNKMTPQERMKRYNNAQNTLNKVERQQKIAIYLQKEILSLMRNVKRRNSNSNSNSNSN